MKHVLLTVLFVLGLSLSAQAASTISWDCNPPADPAKGIGATKEFIIEKTFNGTVTKLATVPQPTPCAGKLSFVDPADLPVGSTVFSVYAVSPTGVVSPKATFSKTVTLPPIGPMTITLGVVTETSIAFSYTIPAGAKASLRIVAPGQGWGTATIIDCPVSPCKVTGLLPNTTYELHGIPYEGVLGSTTRYGTFVTPLVVKTLVPSDPPPPVPTGFTVADAIREANAKCDASKSCSFSTWRAFLKTAMKKVAA